MDDSEISCAVIATALRSAGFDVRAVNALGEFNVTLKSWQPHLVLTDVNMPGVSGPELCQWIKARMDTQGVPVVLISEMAPEAHHAPRTIRDVASEAGRA